jgi:hypothetical protein
VPTMQGTSEQVRERLPALLHGTHPVNFPQVQASEVIASLVFSKRAVRLAGSHRVAGDPPASQCVLPSLISMLSASCGCPQSVAYGRPVVVSSHRFEGRFWLSLDRSSADRMPRHRPVVDSCDDFSRRTHAGTFLIQSTNRAVDRVTVNIHVWAPVHRQNL